MERLRSRLTDALLAQEMRVVGNKHTKNTNIQTEYRRISREGDNSRARTKGRNEKREDLFCVFEREFKRDQPADERCGFQIKQSVSTLLALSTWTTEDLGLYCSCTGRGQWLQR